MSMLKRDLRRALNAIRRGATWKDKLRIFVCLLFHFLAHYSNSPRRFSFIKNRLLKNVTVKLWGVKYLLNDFDSFIVISPSHEREVLLHMIKILRLRRGSVFVDVGAHIGKYSILFAKVIGEKGKVIAIEPDPRSYNTLLSNIRLNGLKNVIALNYAAYNEDCKLKFYLNARPSVSSIKVEKPQHVSGVIYIDAKKLDSIMDELGINRIDIVKIDVEGSEREVLRGFIKRIRRDKPFIIVEVSNSTYNDVIKFMKENGYGYQLIAKYGSDYYYLFYPYGEISYGGVDDIGQGT